MFSISWCASLVTCLFCGLTLTQESLRGGERAEVAASLAVDPKAFVACVPGMVNADRNYGRCYGCERIYVLRPDMDGDTTCVFCSDYIFTFMCQRCNYRNVHGYPEEACFPNVKCIQCGCTEALTDSERWEFSQFPKVPEETMSFADARFALYPDNIEHWLAKHGRKGRILRSMVNASVALERIRKQQAEKWKRMGHDAMTWQIVGANTPVPSTPVNPQQELRIKNPEVLFVNINQ